MKLVMISCRFEYNGPVERILAKHEVQDFIRAPSVEGSDSDGKHMASKIHPGHMAQVWAQLEDEAVDALLEDLQAFKESKKAHGHLTALVLSVDKSL